jgi:hypothetical protein
VCAPFVVQNAELGLHSEVGMTSDTFVVPRPVISDGADTTEYEIVLYDASGNPIGRGRMSRNDLSLPAMHTTTISSETY